MNRMLFCACLALTLFSGCKEGPGGKLGNPAALTEQAPPRFEAGFQTNEGEFVISVNREWAPAGADRFYNLVKNGFFDETRFFRVVDGFVVQFGIHGNPAISAAWEDANIPDDPVRQSNTRGMVTFATSGPNTRTTQLFINLADNPNLDQMGFSPFGTVTEGMETVEKLYSDYGEGAPRGAGPDQSQISSQGNQYLIENFPELDYIEKATIRE